MDRLVAVVVGLVIAAIVGFTGWAIYEHITAPHAGVVHDRDFSPAHTSVVCTTMNKMTSCTPQYYGPEWSFDLYARGGHHGWRDVSEGDYQRYHVGDYYPG